MLLTDSIDFNTHLPPYRSLLNPNARYDYRTHTLIPLSQNDLNRLQLSFKNKKNNSSNGNNYNNHSSNANSKSSTNGLKMKYKSLLSDVSRTLSLRLSNNNLSSSNRSTNSELLSSSTPVSPPSTATSSNTMASSFHQSCKIINNSSTFVFPQTPVVKLHIKNLPVEILDHIISLVDSKVDYKSCLYTCKLFYVLAKPYYYENLKFISTYRFAEFITYLRLNSDVGQFIKSVDLSNIKAGYDEDEDTNHGINVDGNFEINRNDHLHNDDLRANENPNHDNHIDLTNEVKNDNISNKIYAGWRDWKFKNNPLYTIHPYPSTSLTKISSNSQYSIGSLKSCSSQKSSSSLTSKRLSKPFKYFKSKKRSRSYTNSSKSRKSPKLSHLKLGENDSGRSSSTLSRNASPHPLINKFLLNYSTSKDIPVGYILHLLNLCPNITELNLGNLSLSTDYEVSRSTINKYQTFDLMNNYPKDLVYKIDKIMKLNNLEETNYDNNYYNGIFNATKSSNRVNANFFQANQSLSSTASSIYSVTTFSKPIRKYNSLLPPIPPTIADISYLNKGDGKVYLSDLNLKSINNLYLQKINEDEILSAIVRVHGKRLMFYNSKFYFNPTPLNTDIAGSLKYINLSSMIWLNRSMIEDFLKRLLTKRSNDLTNYGYYDTDVFSCIEQGSSLDYDSFAEESSFDHPIIYKQDLIIDFTDSGMYKNLQWAKKVDLRTYEGCNLASKIINNNLSLPFEEFMRRERQRRGRIGENYLA